MTEKETILTVDLYDNVLAGRTGDFTGKVRITGTTRTSDISNRTMKKRTEYHPETITNILDLSYDEMIETLAQGHCVTNKLGQWLLIIDDSFDGKKSDFRSPENRITVMFTLSATLLKALESVYVNADVATVGPMIESLTDSITNGKDLRIAPSVPAVIFSGTLLIKEDNPSIGVYFTKGEEGVTPTKVSFTVRNTKSEIIIQIPQLAEGQYWPSVTTQASAGYSLVKDPHTYKFPILLTIGAGGGGDSESPDKIQVYNGMEGPLYPG